MIRASGVSPSLCASDCKACSNSVGKVTERVAVVAGCWVSGCMFAVWYL